MTPGETRPPSRRAALASAHERPDRRRFGEPDEWGGPATLPHVNLLHNRTVPRDEVFGAA